MLILYFCAFTKLENIGSPKDDYTIIFEHSEVDQE